MTTRLTHGEERALYDSNPAAWRAYAAPHLAAALARSSDIGLSWALLTRDTQRVVWPLLDSETQGRVRAAREESTT